MKSIILCEGKTDSTLLGYYLSKVAGWRYLRKTKYTDYNKKDIHPFKVDNPSTQQFEWYIRNNDYLCIYAVGDTYQLENGLSQVWDTNLLTNNTPFDQVAILCDRDDESVEEKILKDLAATICTDFTCHQLLENNTWSEVSFEKSGEQKKVRILPLIMPLDEIGTLETFLLNCRKGIDGCEEILVESCREFVKSIDMTASIHERYTHKRGLKPKITLGTYFSVVSPGRTFDAGDKILTSIDWDEYPLFNKTFEKLSSL